MVVFLCTRPERRGFLKKRDGAGLSLLELPGFSIPELTIPVPERPDSRRAEQYAEAAKENLRVMRVRTILPENGFPYRERFREFRVPELRELTRALGEKLLLASGGFDGGEAALLCAGSLSGCGAAVLEALCRSFRDLLLIAPGKGEALREYLRETRGISAAVNPGPALLARCRTAVFFQSPPYPVALPAKCLVLDAAPEPLQNVSGGRRIETYGITLPPAFRKALPERYDPPSAAVLALGCGALRPDDLTVLDVRVAGC